RSPHEPGPVDDDDLAAAAVEARERSLEGHRGGQVDRVEQRVAFRAIRAHADAAERRTQPRRVDDEERGETRSGVLELDDLFRTPSRAAHPPDYAPAPLAARLLSTHDFVTRRRRGLESARARRRMPVWHSRATS